MGFLDFLFGSTSPEEDKKLEKKADKKSEKKAKQEKQWKDPNEQEKYVCEAGKVMCPFCNPPFGGFVVTSNTVSLQDRYYVTEGDNNGKVNLDFKGVCTHPSQKAPPCKVVISTTQWKNCADTYVNDYKPLLVKSTIPCMISGQDIKIIHSGQKAVLTEVNPLKKAKEEKSVKVKIGRVIRGNPYVSKNAVNVGLPDSVPLDKTYEVEVKVIGSGTVDLAIINSSSNNGNATIIPSSITATTKVTIKGTVKTKAGHGSLLKIEAKVNGIVKATSRGFSVCCHPINYTDTYYSDVYTPAKLGVVVQDGWSSDNGNFADLKDTKISEVVSYTGINNTPPFPLRNAIGSSNSGYLSGDQLSTDTHSIPRNSLTLTAVGISEAQQLCIYKCDCCGAIDIVLPNSGFQRIHKVFKSGTQWKHRTEKIGASVTIGAYVTEAGNANVISPDHNLP